MDAEGIFKNRKIKERNSVDTLLFGENKLQDCQQQSLENAAENEESLALSTLSNEAHSGRFLNDKEYLLNIFPEDVWYLIFDTMKNFDDLEKLSNSSLYLRRLLHSKRPVFLFQKVWKVVGPKYECSNKEMYKIHGNTYSMLMEPVFYDENAFSSEEFGLCSSCKRMRFTHRFSELKKLRLVCKAWNQAIDSGDQWCPQDSTDNLKSLDDGWSLKLASYIVFFLMVIIIMVRKVFRNSFTNSRLTDILELLTGGPHF